MISLYEDYIVKGFNTYINQLDYSGLTDLFYKKGEKRILKRKEFFLRQNDSSLYAGYVEKGAFRFTRIGDSGKEAVVGFSFEKEFICDYSSFLKKSNSIVNIQATTESVVYVISLYDYLEYLNTGSEEQCFRHKAAEALFEMVYTRLLETYCDTPEQRYIKLMQRFPNLKEKVPLKEIASFLGVTPETVSHIRKKLSYSEKS